MTAVTTSSPSLISEGLSYPLGATPYPDGSINFAVVSQFASEVNLCLFADPENPHRETHRIALSKRSGDTWHALVGGIAPGTTYGYRADGSWQPQAGLFFNPSKLLLDPYAKWIDGPSRYHPTLRSSTEPGKLDRFDSSPYAPKAFVPIYEAYDWEGDFPLQIPMRDTVIYETHVKGFSKRNPAVPEALQGTYAGLAHPASIAYLQELGITTVQLLPVHHHLDDGFLLRRELVNYWGYNTLGFFAPEARYAAGPNPVAEFRAMIKALHRAGLEVILDVVYNHTCEAGVDGPTTHLRGLDNICYYHTDPANPGRYRDYTGCGNSVDVSHPRSLRLIMDSLRYWVQEMHVDGFRFDLAVELGRRAENYDRRATFFQAIHQDPVLGPTKLIAEPWDLGPGGYQIGNFPTDWAELNGKFRDGVRRFWRGDPGVSGEFAARITGSEDVFSHNRRTPQASVNFICSHDGFTLADLVSYNQKHNLENGEKNADGDSHNISYNHGVEGDTDDPAIKRLRHRQIRNFLTTLICSQGVPFLLGGDERLRTQLGNNNTYCQDNELSWLSWEDTPETAEMRVFVARLLKFRRETSALLRGTFFTGEESADSCLPDVGCLPDVSWLRPDGGAQSRIDWGVEKPGAFAMLLSRTVDQPALLFFFNARHEATRFRFPPTPVCKWNLVLETGDPHRQQGGARAETTIQLVDRSLQIWQEEL